MAQRPKDCSGKPDGGFVFIRCSKSGSAAGTPKKAKSGRPPFIMRTFTAF